MGNVLSWYQALDRAYEPRPYGFSNCPVGIFQATLNFKIWAKKPMAILCYFTSIDGITFHISVFRRQTDEAYKINGCEIDFTECPLGRIYQLRIEKNGGGNAYLKSCLLFGDME